MRTSAAPDVPHHAYSSAHGRFPTNDTKPSHLPAIFNCLRHHLHLRPVAPSIGGHVAKPDFLSLRDTRMADARFGAASISRVRGLLKAPGEGEGNRDAQTHVCRADVADVQHLHTRPAPSTAKIHTSSPKFSFPIGSLRRPFRRGSQCSCHRRPRLRREGESQLAGHLPELLRVGVVGPFRWDARYEALLSIAVDTDVRCYLNARHTGDAGYANGAGSGSLQSLKRRRGVHIRVGTNIRPYPIISCRKPCNSDPYPALKKKGCRYVKYIRSVANRLS